MTILIVGSDNNWSIERLYRDYFQQRGARVKIFAAQNMFMQEYSRSILHKIAVRSGIVNLYRSISEKLLSELKTNPVDIVFVFKGMEIDPKTLLEVRKYAKKVVNFNPDNPFIFSGRGSGNKNITSSLALYDLHLTYDHDTKDKLESVYGICAQIVPFGYDLSTETYSESILQTEINKVCFLGNPDKERAQFIKLLASCGIEIDVFGHGWNKFLTKDEISIFDAVYGKEFWYILRRYRVQLNLMRPHNPQSHNMRTFEVPAVGGLMVAPATRDHTYYFEPQKEIFLFQDLASCENQCKMLLGLSKEEANQFRNNARNRSVSSGYSYYERAGLVLENLEFLLQK